jgi:parvulin-like peptidyl-prolyl isomerase
VLGAPSPDFAGEVLLKKNSKQEKAPLPMTKRQLSRHQREQRLRALLLAALGLLAIVVFGILAYGYWREFVHIADEPVARIGDKEIPTRALAKGIGYYDSYYANQAVAVQRFIADNQQAAESDEAKKNLVEAATYRLQQLQAEASQLEAKALDELIEGELLRREAERRGLTIEEADRDRALVQHYDLGVEALARQLAAATAEEGSQTPAAEADRPPTPDQVAAAKEKMAQILDNGRVLSEEEFAALILEPAAIRIKIQSELAATVPATAEQVHAYHILVQTEQEAKDALALLKSGDLDFAATAKQLSQDPGSKDKGGDLGWFPRGVMDPAFEEVAFSLEPGQMSDPVSTSFGWHIIKVEEKAAARPVEASILEYQHASAYAKWLAEQKENESNKVAYLLDTAKMEWARNNAPKAEIPEAKG